MSRYNSVPIIIQQMVETLKDERASQNEKFNRAQVLEATRDFCDIALETWKKEQNKRKR